MGNRTPVLYNFNQSLLQYQPVGTTNWVSVPFFGSAGAAGSGVGLGAVSAVDSDTVQHPTRPRGPRFNINLASYAPTHRANHQLTQYANAGTWVGFRFLTAPEVEVAASFNVTVSGGIVTAVSGATAPSLETMGRGHAFKKGSQYYTIERFGDDLNEDGALNTIHFFPSGLTSGAVILVKPRCIRGPFLGIVNGAGDFGGEANGVLESDFTVTAAGPIPPWRPVNLTNVSSD